MKLYALIAISLLCCGLTACGPGEYYSPVHNQFGNAQPLSKTDIIRVIVPARLEQEVKIARSHEKGQSDSAYTNAMYIGMAKIYTDKKLQAMGYHVVGGGLKGGADGHPNVIILVDSKILKQYTDKVLWQTPSTMDANGQTTSWQVNSEDDPRRIISYNIKIIRPTGSDNPLLQCKITPFSAKSCLAPEHPSNYETIFEGDALLDTDSRSPGYAAEHLVEAVFYQYPTVQGYKRVYLVNRILPQATRVINGFPKDFEVKP